MIFLEQNYKDSCSALEKLKHDIAKETTGAIIFTDILELHPLAEDKVKRMLMFKIPSAAITIPIGWRNRYYGRNGDSLVDLSQEKIDRIRGKRRTDWAKEIVDGATINHQFQCKCL